MKRVVLHNIRSNYNVGATFRTSDGAGVDKIYLTGFTPSPLDRFGREVAEISKTALGAEKFIAWEKVDDVIALIKQLKQEMFLVVGVELADDAISVYDFKVPEKVVYIFGSETEGLSKEIMEAVDVILEIPMSGQKESLNVSVTAGVVLFHQ
jgi:tRNA G18 (ribose-2'-O)-methylase SpoU